MTPTPPPTVADRPMTRRERKVERMRSQRIGHAHRSTFRVSGTPYLARQAEFTAVPNGVR